MICAGTLLLKSLDETCLGCLTLIFWLVIFSTDNDFSLLHNNTKNEEDLLQMIKIIA